MVRKGKGSKNKHFFPKGNNFHLLRGQQAEPKEVEESTDSPSKFYYRIDQNVAEKAPNVISTLRTIKKPEVPVPENNKLMGNRLINLEMLGHMMNSVVKEHLCAKPDFIFTDESVQGLGVGFKVGHFISFSCTKIQLISQNH